MGLFDWNLDGKIDVEDDIFEYDLLFGDDLDSELNSDIFGGSDLDFGGDFTDF